MPCPRCFGFTRTCCRTMREVSLPALPRMIFVVHGSVAIADRSLRDGEAWSGEGAVTLKAGSGGATLWRWELVRRRRASAALPAARALSRAKNFPRGSRPLPQGRAAAARRQRRLPAGRLRLFAPASGSRHPLPARGRHPHRYARPLDLLRSRRRLVRERARSGVRAGRRPADALHPRHDPAGGLCRQKLGRVSQRGRQGEAENRSSTRSSPTCR